jgi:hypothetical protein
MKEVKTMAYNLGIDRDNRKSEEDYEKAAKHVAAAIKSYCLRPPVEESAPFDNSVDSSGKPKEQYYMEWWRIGDEQAHIENGEFHTNDIRNFVKTFLSFNKYTIVYLVRCRDNTVLKNARSTVRNVAR